MTGWLILFFICIGVALICLSVDLIVERKNIKKYGSYEPNFWAITVFAACIIFALVFGLVAIAVPISSAHALTDVQAILEVDPTNDVAVASIVKWIQEIERFGRFADKWLVREELAELIITYGG